MIPTCAAHASSPRARATGGARAAWSQACWCCGWPPASAPCSSRATWPHLSVFGWPLSFYLAAQGASLIYLAIIGVYAWRMRVLDREYTRACSETPHERRRPEERRESRRQARALLPPPVGLLPVVHACFGLFLVALASSKTRACRASGSATCTCSPPSCCTPPSAWSAAPRTCPNTTWRDGACRRCSTAWPPPPTGSRRPASSAWPAPSTCTVSTPSPT
jgi:hypothetical protein